MFQGSNELFQDVRLKKLHYAALEIYTVEKKFVEQLELIAVVSNSISSCFCLSKYHVIC